MVFQIQKLLIIVQCNNGIVRQQCIMLLYVLDGFEYYECAIGLGQLKMNHSNKNLAQ